MLELSKPVLSNMEQKALIFSYAKNLLYLSDSKRETALRIAEGLLMKCNQMYLPV